MGVRIQHSTTQSYNLPATAQSQGAFGSARIWMREAAKRSLDVLVSLCGLIFLAPFFLMIAIWIKLDTPGPIFYRGPRLGRGGKQFSILKFRTMYEQVESYTGPRLTAQDDPRVTSLGRWLRDTKLNELPQLWNVLKGEMSLVGPRPEDPELAATWLPEVRAEIFSVRPGITSPASVLFRGEETLLSSSKLVDTYLGEILPSKLRLDQLYVRNRSLLMDLDVIFWTFLLLLPRVGSIAPPEEWLFIGPLTRLVRRYLSWFVVDLIVTFLAIGFSGAFWRSFGPLVIGWPRAIGIAIGFSLLYSLVGAAMGIHRINWSYASFADTLDLLPAIGLATTIALVLNTYFYDQGLLPPGLIIMSAVLASAGFVTVRYRSRLIMGLADRMQRLQGSTLQAQERVLIVGGGESGQFMAWWVQNGRGAAGLRVIGFVDDDLQIQDMRIRGIKVLGKREDIPDLVTRYDIGIILFAIHNIPNAERQRLLDICLRTPAKVVGVPDILGQLRQVAHDNDSENKASASQNQSIDRLGANTLELNSSHMTAWLAELAGLAERGDLEAVKKQVSSMQETLQRI